MNVANRAKILLGTICSMIGVMFIIAGVFMIVSVIRFRQLAIETTAEIIEINRTAHASNDRYSIDSISVAYSIDGEFYNGNYKTTSNTNKEGDYITIYYNSNNPNQIRTDISFISGIMIGMLGIFFGAAGFAEIIDRLNRESKNVEVLE